MDENNVHTSVLIELANHEEPEDQKTYRIDIDDVDSPKDYVIDQIFCGENVTVYALFEVPEGSKISDHSLIDVPNSHLQENYKFFHRNSYKEVINEKKINRFKHNSFDLRSDEDMKFSSNKIRGNGSLYCLKHLGGDYEMLIPEKKNSELKVLYSKETVSNETKCKTPKKLKFKSKGVNTDIVQSPRIMEEVQRAVGVNIPFVRSKDVEDSCSSFSKSSFKLIETEMRQSYSSINSDSDKKSVPNFFIVPLLMMEDGTLSHYEKTDKSQKCEKKKLFKRIITSKVPLGTNTDISFDSYQKTGQDSNEVSQFENYKTNSENYEDRNLYDKNENSKEELKINSKDTIIKEIKIMQRKLNTLINSIESSDFVFNEKKNDSNNKTINDKTDNLERMSEPLLNETFQKKYQKFEERPIFLPFEYPSYSNKLKAKKKERTQGTSIKEKRSASALKSIKTSAEPKQSVSNDFLRNNASSESTEIKNDQTAKDNVKKLTSNFQMDCFDSEIRKTFRPSKSECCVRIIIPILKLNPNNGLKKSQSFDLKGDKLEALKKTKNFLYKAESFLKTKTNIRIHQNKESPLRDNLSLMKCEMGDDVDKKTNTNNEVLNVTQVTQKAEKTKKLENSDLEEIVTDMKKNLYKEKGDAKSVYPKETLVTENAEKVQVHNHYSNIMTSENLLKPKKRISPRTVISKTADKNTEVGAKIISDAEKPITPNKNSRKINTIESSAKKDVKISKRINNKVKIVERNIKLEGKDFLQTEGDKKKALTGSRKSARHNGESKLHIDKLIKLDSMGNNHRASPLAKYNHDEKAGVKNERVPRPISQKQERSEHFIDMLFDENIKEKSEIHKKKSVTLVRVESFHKNNVKETEEPLCLENEGKMAGEVNLKMTSENFFPLSTNPSSVVVELFSKKPKSENEFYNEVDQENFEKSFRRENMTFEKNQTENETNKNSENLEKPAVKSVWALTKVLLYEDGTNKLEVLEASLTPPDYSLN